MKHLEMIFEETVKVKHSLELRGTQTAIDSALEQIEEQSLYTDIDDALIIFGECGVKVVSADLAYDETTEELEYFDEMELED